MKDDDDYIIIIQSENMRINLVSNEHLERYHIYVRFYVCVYSMLNRSECVYINLI